MKAFDILEGDCLEQLQRLPKSSVQTCVTSPPYWQQRDYGAAGQLGQEDTVHQYVRRIVNRMRQVRRVLRSDGTLWLVLGDAYTGARGGGAGKNSEFAGRKSAPARVRKSTRTVDGLGRKQLCMVPARVALALQEDGWVLRSDIIWNKSNAKPESVRDRPTVGHEYVYLFSKTPQYFYNRKYARTLTEHLDTTMEWEGMVSHAESNWRTVWNIPTQPFKGAHDAPFPFELVRRCILAGSRAGDMVLDPFLGAGTSGLAALRLGRRFVGVELNKVYVELVLKRLRAQQLHLPVDVDRVEAR